MSCGGAHSNACTSVAESGSCRFINIIILTKSEDDLNIVNLTEAEYI